MMKLFAESKKTSSCGPFEIALSGCRHSIYIRTVSSSIPVLCTGTFVSFLAEIKCTVHVALPKRPINRYSQVPNKRVYSLNYCNVELLALIRAKSSKLQ